jgi:DNA-binding Xre family transcriptional regulator
MQRLKVKEIAQAKGFTMAGLSRKADINLKTMQAIYRDPYRDVAYSTLSKIAKALDASITDLVEDVPGGE